MIEIFLSVKYPEIYIVRFSSEVSSKEAEISNKFFLEKFRKKKDITTVVLVDPEATLVDKGFLTLAAKNVTQNSHLIKNQYIVGLSSIQKLYFKFYRNLLGKINFKQELLENLQLLEEKCGFNFQDDFICHLKI